MALNNSSTDQHFDAANFVNHKPAVAGLLPLLGFQIVGGQPGLATAQHAAGASDSSVVAVISRGGGVVALPAFGRVIFPEGSFATPESVTVWVTDRVSTPRWLDMYDHRSEGMPPYLPYDLRVSAASLPTHGYDIEIRLPPSYRAVVSDPSSLSVFREFIGGGRMEALIMYDEVSSAVDWQIGVIRARVRARAGDAAEPLYDIFIVGCCAPAL